MLNILIMTCNINILDTSTRGVQNHLELPVDIMDNVGIFFNE